MAHEPCAFLSDESAGLHVRWLACIAKFRPATVLVENVPEMLNVALARPKDRALGDGGEALRLRDLVDPSGRDAADTRLLDHGNQRVLILLGSRDGGEQLPWRSLGTQSCKMPSRVSRARPRW